MGYLTVEDLRSSYGFRVADSNLAILERALASAETICLRYIGLGEGLWFDCTDYFDGGRRILSLENAPVLSVDSVSIDASREFGETLGSSDYRVDLKTGTIHLYVSSPEAHDCIRVEYEAGYSRLPEDVAMGIAMTCQKIMSDLQGSAVGVLSRTLEGGSETLDSNLPTLAVRQMLDSYRIRRAR